KEATPRDPGRAESIVGSSPGMVELFKLVSRVAGTRSSVLIQGESGTGKELIARTIHRNSPRRGHPFVAVSCMSFSEGVLESELFGHVRGAFTGATDRRPGLFLQADRSTLFLDEIGDMGLSMQSKLLRVLQEMEVRPVGGTETVPVDVRVVAATHHNLESLVGLGKFREDLFYRLNVVTLKVPPLRDRVEDIPLIASHYLTVFGEQAGRPIHGFTPAAMAALRTYPWPGNVRELVNVVERAVALAPGSVVELSDLPEKLATRVRIEGPPAGSAGRQTLAELTRSYVMRVLEETKGNKTEAARVLGVPRRTFYRMLSRLSTGDGDGGQVSHYDPIH
ncbi:MAG: sigma-54-dependent Fis family transcriptional regulator, partial [Candidatus Latescibacteria bacterium]|nr:sigma-54-dependent Fis family transcriptional regulator [Candidatus Latescibacterota bacterium]